jgi:hypothetical protein
MPHPYVTKVTFTGGQIILTVQVDEFLSPEFPNELVEISGYASQNSGGFAIFYDMQPVKATPDGTVLMYIKSTPAQGFKNGEPVTVSLRAAKVWVTVLTESQDGQMTPASATEDPTPPEGTAWGTVTAVEWPSSGGPLPLSSAGQASAGGDSNFPPA